ncbi:hypothetical protein BSLG_002185 [Batrachochytrium salamandrivorans]|nr:hypothetical protein BSLG_002185 [Batrachochytrium salamandrivorans]
MKCGKNGYIALRLNLTPAKGTEGRSRYPSDNTPGQRTPSFSIPTPSIADPNPAAKYDREEVLKLEVAKDQCTADLEKGQEEKEQQLDSLAAIEAVERMLSSSKKALREAESELKAVMS